MLKKVWLVESKFGKQDENTLEYKFPPADFESDIFNLSLQLEAGYILYV